MTTNRYAMVNGLMITPDGRKYRISQMDISFEHRPIRQDGEETQHEFIGTKITFEGTLWDATDQSTGDVHGNGTSSSDASDMLSPERRRPSSGE